MLLFVGLLEGVLEARLWLLRRPLLALHPVTLILLVLAMQPWQLGVQLVALETRLSPAWLDLGYQVAVELVEVVLQGVAQAVAVLLEAVEPAAQQARPLPPVGEAHLLSGLDWCCRMEGFQRLRTM